MDLLGSRSLIKTPDIRHKARHFHWFRATFREEAEQLGPLLARQFTVDETALTRTFLEWHRRFEANKGAAKDNRVNFVSFSAGLMLCELVKNDPVTASPRAATPTQDLSPELSAILAFWPEGLLYVEFCIAVANAVLRQDFGEEVRLSPSALDLRTWWSFKENAHEDPALAIAFFDLFTGREPDWSHPAMLSLRPQQKALAPSEG